MAAGLSERHARSATRASHRPLSSCPCHLSCPLRAPGRSSPSAVSWDPSLHSHRGSAGALTQPPLRPPRPPQVHKGRWRGTLVAVKRLREDIANDRELLEFRRELAIVNHLAHPNIVQFLGAVTNSMPMCIVTEYLPGGNVADVLAARGDDNPLPLKKALRWALDCTLGMRYLHERRPTMIIHRDLKPENLLVDASERVKITDFGLSKSAMQLRGERLGHGEEQTVSRTTCGTWLYTAPEVFKKEPYTAKVDQFAFAMIVYELLMGTTPFRGISAEEATVQLAMGHRPPFKRHAPAELKALVEKCWAQDPFARPSFAEIEDGLSPVYNKTPDPEGEGEGVRKGGRDGSTKKGPGSSGGGGKSPATEPSRGSAAAPAGGAGGGAGGGSKAATANAEVAQPQGCGCVIS